MQYRAHVQNRHGDHRIMLQTGDDRHSLQNPPKAEGFGSSANGGELLFLALATCYCNDIYREAARLGIEVQGIEVEVTGEFTAAGQPANDVRYRARVTSDAPEADLHRLLAYTDEIAEIQQTVRIETPVQFEQAEIIRPN